MNYVLINVVDVLPVVDGLVNNEDMAVEYFNRGEDFRRKFAEQVAFTAGEQTARIAERIKRSVSFVESYRNAYKLYYELEREYETSQPFTMWNELPPQMWVKAATAKSVYTLNYEQIMKHLKHAHKHGLSVDAFREHIDTAHGYNSGYEASRTLLGVPINSEIVICRKFRNTNKEKRGYLSK